MVFKFRYTLESPRKFTNTNAGSHPKYLVQDMVCMSGFKAHLMVLKCNWETLIQGEPVDKGRQGEHCDPGFSMT